MNDIPEYRQLPENVQLSINPANVERWDEEGKKYILEIEIVLALLLINEVVFINDSWYEKDWPEEAKRQIRILVSCNDIFAWGCSDAESIEYGELFDLYEFWRKDPGWGGAIWCMIKRKELPQEPVAKYIKQAGIWDLQALKAEHGLRDNYYDGVSYVSADMKYKMYSKWAESLGKVVRPFDKEWWDGWREFIIANANWRTKEYDNQEDCALNEWRRNNGFKER
jgi:hypothetical protein